MTTWFTSDEHYDHRNIIAYSARPFADVAEMQREMIARHNAVVRPEDDVWHLGDFALNEKTVPLVLPQLVGRHHLVTGNHDACHPCHKKHAAAKRKYLLFGFASVATEIRMGPFLLNHLPYVGDSAHEPRFPEWRPKDEGKWLLHGHVHELWKVRDRMINVGVDQWGFAPVRFETIQELAQGTERRAEMDE
jgi:calcineurin-like phosphoesterase family protein